jgi:hypothetical protein
MREAEVILDVKDKVGERKDLKLKLKKENKVYAEKGS